MLVLNGIVMEGYGWNCNWLMDRFVLFDCYKTFEVNEERNWLLTERE